MLGGQILVAVFLRHVLRGLDGFQSLLRIFFSYNLALSEKKCNFVGDIQLKEKIMATLTDVDAEAMRQRLVVKESLTQAFKELRAAEASGAELPDARKLFK